MIYLRNFLYYLTFCDVILILILLNLLNLDLLSSSLRSLVVPEELMSGLAHS